MTLYTLVQHSGVTTGHAEFTNAVELRSITSQQVDKVKTAGGLVFEDYTSASEAEEATNYPPEVTGLIPHARGSFSRTKIGGSPVYVPASDLGHADVKTTASVYAGSANPDSIGAGYPEEGDLA